VGARPGTEEFGAGIGEPVEGEVGRVKPGDERDGAWLLGLGRIEGGALGRAVGAGLGRMPGLEPRDGLGAAEGRGALPPEGRGAAEPREPWLEDGREAEPPLDPREGETDDPDEPFEPRWGSAKAAPTEPIQSRESPTMERMFVFMCVPMEGSDLVDTQNKCP
jgi:hypothetical protein